MIESTIAEAQGFMRRHRMDGWLLYDYHGMNPALWELLGPVANVTRPCWCLVPPRGRPRLLVHHVDAGRFAPLGLPTASFSSRREMVARLRAMLRGRTRVAMEYSPMGELPRASRVDAGVVELVRSLGARVVSSADLFQYATLRWSADQLASHRSAAAKLSAIALEAFQYIGLNLIAEATEWDVAEFMRRRFREEGLESPDGPVVAANAHGSDPHYDPEQETAAVIRRGDWVLIDLWARERRDDAMFADITWVGYVGARPPDPHQRAFEAVIGARDAALEHIERTMRAGRPLKGWQVDRVARQYIARRGLARYFTHRLGHSLGREVHADAVNLDSWETRDTRQLLTGIAVTIEPGVYLPTFGVRSEIDVYIGEGGPEVTTTVQREVVRIGEG